ncbi:MAG: molybdate ABC transporter permease subunit [Alphaproteobacteria bacterium]|nr:molybdate ABC transporter permease subunit [Alphaproteobacteria bacterium]
MSELSAADWQSILLSLKVGAWSVVVSLPIAFGLAYVLARVDFVLKPVVTALVLLPLVLPPVVTGYLLLLTFGRNGPVGLWLYDWFGVTVAFRWTGAVIAAAVMGLPLMVTGMRLSLESVDRRIEMAARTLGASPWRAFWTVTLPLSLPGIVGGSVLSFARSVGEFGATITFVSNIPGETRTLPIAIYSLLQSPTGDSAALKLSLIAIGLSIGAIIVAELLHRRLPKATGRDDA